MTDTVAGICIVVIIIIVHANAVIVGGIFVDVIVYRTGLTTATVAAAVAVVTAATIAGTATTTATIAFSNVCYLRRRYIFVSRVRNDIFQSCKLRYGTRHYRRSC